MTSDALFLVSPLNPHFRSFPFYYKDIAKDKSSLMSEDKDGG